MYHIMYKMHTSVVFIVCLTITELGYTVHVMVNIYIIFSPQCMKYKHPDYR